MIGNSARCRSSGFLETRDKKLETRQDMIFSKLNVFKKAYALSLAIYRRSLDFPALEQHELASQMRRSGKSFCANIGEGMGKQTSAKEVLRFVRMAIGSCDETRIWLRYSFDLKYISSAEYEEYYEGYCEVSRMLSGLIKHWSVKSSFESLVSGFWKR